MKQEPYIPTTSNNKIKKEADIKEEIDYKDESLIKSEHSKLPLRKNIVVKNRSKFLDSSSDTESASSEINSNIKKEPSSIKTEHSKLPIREKVFGKSKRKYIEISSDSESVSSDISTDEKYRCPICLSSFKDQSSANPDVCEHRFCLECIQEWSNKTNTCPIDRKLYKFIIASIFDQVTKTSTTKKIPVKDQIQRNDDYDENDVTHCEICHRSDREDRMLLCDSCDNGYHCECLSPSLDEIPEGQWFCQNCRPTNRTRLRRVRRSRNGTTAFNSRQQFNSLLVQESNQESISSSIQMLLENVLPSTSRPASSRNAEFIRPIARTRFMERIRHSVNSNRMQRGVYIIETEDEDESEISGDDGEEGEEEGEESVITSDSDISNDTDNEHNTNDTDNERNTNEQGFENAGHVNCSCIMCDENCKVDMTKTVNKPTKTVRKKRKTTRKRRKTTYKKGKVGSKSKTTTRKRRTKKRKRVIRKKASTAITSQVKILKSIEAAKLQQTDYAKINSQKPLTLKSIELELMNQKDKMIRKSRFPINSQASWCQNSILNEIDDGSKQSTNQPPPSTSSFNFLDSIISSQKVLLTHSSKVNVKRDGSIQLNETDKKQKSLSLKNSITQSLTKNSSKMSTLIDETNKKEEETNDNLIDYSIKFEEMNDNLINYSTKIEEYDPFNPDDSQDENEPPKVPEKIKFEIKSANVEVLLEKTAVLEDSPMKGDDTTQNENENGKDEKVIDVNIHKENKCESDEIKKEYNENDQRSDSCNPNGNADTEKSSENTKSTYSSAITEIKPEVIEINDKSDSIKSKSNDNDKKDHKKDYKNHEKSDKSYSDKSLNDRTKSNRSKSPYSIKKESKTRSKSKSPSSKNRANNNDQKNISKSSRGSNRRSRSRSRSNRDRTKDRNSRENHRQSNQKSIKETKRSRSRSHKSLKNSRSPPPSRSNKDSSRSHHYRNHDEKDYNNRNDRSVEIDYNNRRNRDNRHSDISDRNKSNKLNNLKRNTSPSPDNHQNYKTSLKSLKSNEQIIDKRIKGADYLIEEMLCEESQQIIDINKISLPVNSEVKIPLKSLKKEDTESLGSKTRLDQRLDLIFGSSAEKNSNGNGNGLKDRNKHENKDLIKKENNKISQKPLTSLEKDLAKFSIAKIEVESSSSKKVSSKDEPYDPEREYQETGSRILNEAKLNDQKLKAKNPLPGANTSTLGSLNLSASNGKKKKHISPETKATIGTVLDNQEKIVEAAKLALKPYFVSKKVSKDDYKSIMKKVVIKSLAQNKTGILVNTNKVNKMITEYVNRNNSQNNKETK